MSNFEHQDILKLMFAVLLKRLDGRVVIAQEDIDAIAYSRLEEYDRPAEDAVEFVLIEAEGRAN